MAELFIRHPYLPGDSVLDQLDKVFRALGTPTEQSWPGMTELPDYVEWTQYAKPPLAELFSGAGKEALDLMQGMLMLDPRQRLSAADILKHAYFRKGVKPTPPERLPRLPRDHRGVVEQSGMRMAGIKRHWDTDGIPHGLFFVNTDLFRHGNG